MITQNVDLAAYIALAGKDPEQITLDQQHYICFHYRDTEWIQACVQAYQSDGLVPARAFCEQRKRLKREAWKLLNFVPESTRSKTLRRRTL